MTKEDLSINEYNPYYHQYIQKAGDVTISVGLKDNGDTTVLFLESIPEEKLEFRYEEGKWTIKEIIQHLIDTERVFTYRALCIARKDKTLFPGYDQDAYVVSCEANKRSMSSLMNEYKAVRLASIIMFESFSYEMLTRIGIASNSNLSPRAVAFITIGHENHHCEIIKERYL
ncbi:DinB family protein [Psychroserpens burtonensis]|uniref:DinB family protein n=1 Tax=Psychroserpens burtonensis TaxID=49278 RepID=A0A5C7B6M6_9FLAO|nr:DinB family protein [Psychroserpens burtonensis]TXE15651.1 DinB family protein [Psychroserpens burtonensis]